MSKNHSDQSSTSQKPLAFHILTLFPKVFEPIFKSSLLGKAQEKGLVSFDLIQIRDFATDKHRSVDDKPYGGGEGMVLRADVLHEAWKKAVAAELEEKTTEKSEKKTGSVKTILLSPQGRLFTQELAQELSTASQLVLVCGHYEGVDERFIDECVDLEISIGDYVLTGGEVPAMVVVDGVTRLLPGVVGNEKSVSEDSLEQGLLKYPQYTRPPEFLGRKVPEVLLSGNHGQIAEWRQQQRVERTERKRPDLRRKQASNKTQT